ncbi:hypothetical protein, partial [Corynebacterium sp. HMSC067D03]|uniref:hypothetical protein n=1 Tax=Corynebacterium sp. HMSC067D03 TaxID=1739289 RepID=UPI001AEFB00D
PTQQLHTQTPKVQHPRCTLGVFTYTHMIVVADNSNIGDHPLVRNTKPETQQASLRRRIVDADSSHYATA